MRHSMGGRARSECTNDAPRSSQTAGLKRHPRWHTSCNEKPERHAGVALGVSSVRFNLLTMMVTIPLSHRSDAGVRDYENSCAGLFLAGRVVHAGVRTSEPRMRASLCPRRSSLFLPTRPRVYTSARPVASIHSLTIGHSDSWNCGRKKPK